MSLRSLLLLLSILLAAATNVPKVVRRYLAIQFIATFLVELCLSSAGWEAWAYSFVFTLGSAAMLTGGGLVMWKAVGLVRRNIIRESAIGATFLALVIVMGIQHAWSINTWIVFLEGTVLLAIGSALAQAIPFYIERRDLGTLAILWLSLATFDYAYVLFKPASWVESLNDWLPSWLCISAFGWLTARRWISDRVSLEVQHGRI